jgi:hypothetical protein
MTNAIEVKDLTKRYVRRVLGIVTFGGDGGIRTPYLLTASQTFSRVNYVPKHSI